MFPDVRDAARFGGEVRMRTCAIWPEDDLIVSRLGGGFSGYDELTLVLKDHEGLSVATSTSRWYPGHTKS